MSEETNELSNELPSNVSHMDSAEFEGKLTQFFTKHKQSKLRFVSRIAFEFKGKEDIVLEHLHNKYVLGVVPEKSKVNAVHNSEIHSDDTKNIGAPTKGKPKKKNEQKPVEHSEKPKSKKKLIIIVVIVILCGLGAGGFMMKDKIKGMLGKGHETEKEVPKEKAGSESKAVDKKAKKAMTPEQVEAALDSMDKTKSVPKDPEIKK